MPRSGKLSQSRRRGYNKRTDAPSGPAEDALIIFAKAPLPGQVKTRLCPPLTPDEAASLHGSMVMDVAEHTRDIRNLDRFLACTPSSEHGFFQTLAARYGVVLCEQVGNDLGQRMHNALAEVLSKGYRYALVIGTDIPTLSPKTYKDALFLLNKHDVVIGPTHDGGYYLIGLKQPSPQLFQEVPWSTETVCALTQSKAATLGLTVGQLPTERDLDTFSDLHGIMTETPRRKMSTRTTTVLQTLLQRHGQLS
ncbi:TIGR04282 family arsenosugar biosynthesis glycosyltransferase [Candidatus Nitronereus thalassa]|uniref:TIGR04282 family arsenosugar biosynthesis glycosyltransferase n=1 Tax=Candidatus Nitronereus thalassa TaxID=3020898 RepID=A0ABU3KAB8_9BACT|nr:TIGR04282 family arsenosugar biosynthesis glycosyltransferase [Candidatus Nitronereus thalassa]MDT7043253.1 TIGR04282 family arsenosugar biosynthesis glycosyltransferase [Candidatus Nitronereus thalassa]